MSDRFEKQLEERIATCAKGAQVSDRALGLMDTLRAVEDLRRRATQDALSVFEYATTDVPGNAISGGLFQMSKEEEAELDKVEEAEQQRQRGHYVAVALRLPSGLVLFHPRTTKFSELSQYVVGEDSVDPIPETVKGFVTSSGAFVEQGVNPAAEQALEER